MKVFAGLMAALVLATGPVSPVAPASAAIEQCETFHGCVVTVGDD